MKMKSSLARGGLYGILSCSFMALLGFTWAYQEPPGLSSPTAIGPYLNRAFPTNYAEHQYQWNLVSQGKQTGVRTTITYSKVPGTNKMGFGSTEGDIYILDLDTPTTTAIHLGDVTPGITYPTPTSRYGLRGLAFHPDYGQAGSPNSAFIYVTQVTVERTNRLSRFTVSSQTGKIDLASELIMVETVCGIPTFHSIHELRFDAEGYLYFAIGDGHPNNEIEDIMGYVQRIDNNLIGGVFRIDVDRDPTRSHPPRRILDEVGFEGSNQISGKGYYIPNDNPWVHGDGSVMEEYYSLGHRNPWKLSIDTETNTLWVSEVGPHNGEELNRIKKGYNYGWPYRVGTTGEIVWDRTPPEAPEPNPFLGELTGPVFSPPRAKARSLLLGGVYRGVKFPELRGKVFVGDLGSRQIWVVDHDTQGSLSDAPRIAGFPRTYMRTLFETEDGSIMSIHTDGSLYTLGRRSNISEPPQLLSQTGAFTNLNTLEPVDGLLPYGVNTPLWSDRAGKKRWIALPNNGAHDTNAETIVFSENDPWQFPAGTVFVKHFELPMDERHPNRTRNLETRFLIIQGGGEAYGLTYKWNEAQTDATLLKTNTYEDYQVIASDGTSYTQKWQYPGMDECIQCHTSNTRRVLGVNTQQLNGDFTYPSTNITDNQLHTWNSLGMFRSPIGDPDAYVRNVPLDYPKATTEYKIRSYLDANCASCHRPQGVNGAFDARISIPLEEQRLLEGMTISAGSHHSNVVKKGSPESSELYVRDASTGENAMPPLAKTLNDQAYIDMLYQWIDGLQPSGTDAFGEVGLAKADDRWTQVKFEGSYSKPIVVFGGASHTGSDPVTVQVRNLSSDGCEVRLAEWPCQDGGHAIEDIPYLVVEEGMHQLPNGKKIMAGKGPTDHSWHRVSFPDSFDAPPTVFAQVLTANDPEPVIPRIRTTWTGASSFHIRLTNSDREVQAHGTETVGFIAWESGKFDGYLPFEMGTTHRMLDHTWKSIPFQQDYGRTPIVLAKTVSNFGGDPGTLRYRQLSSDKVEAIFQEETCGDTETDHTTEMAGLMVFARKGFLIGETLDTDGPLGDNLALEKPVIQSSTGWSGVPERAVDGNRSGIHGAGSVSHTASSSNPWWRVDLGEAYSISDIQIYNRVDCCASRLSGAKLLVGNTDSNDPNDYKEIGTLGPNFEEFVQDVDVVGRYVMVYLPGDNKILSLAEVEVYGSEEVIPVTGVVVSPSEITLDIGETLALSVAIEPENATNQNVTWISNNPAIASVDENGLVAAVGTGEVEVTASIEDGRYSASSVITVTGGPQPEISVYNVLLSPSTVNLEVGETFQLTATTEPANATNQNMTWISNNSAIASIDTNGLVTAVGAGEIDVTVSAEDGGYSASTLVTVTGEIPPPVSVYNILVAPTAITLGLGETFTLTATTEPGNATNQGVTWFSNDPNIASIDPTGLVTATGLGEIDVTAVSDDGGYSASAIINVVVSAQSSDINVYPIPATGRLNVDLTEYMGNEVEIKLYNQNNSLLETFRVDRDHQQVNELILDNYPSGYYYLLFQTSDSWSAQPIIIN